MPAAVSISNLNFSFGETRVLENITLEIPEGAMLSVIGPNGGGKTTLLRLLLGLLAPDSGEIRIFGRPVEAARDLVGYMPQSTHYDSLFPITVAEVVQLGRLAGGFWRRYGQEDRQAAGEALEMVGMTDFARRPFGALSGGQRQRVLIARALAGRPRLLLLDEPTSNVDVAVANKFYELLRSLNETMTILLVSHDLGVVANTVDQVICVNRTAAVHPVSAMNNIFLHDTYGIPLNVVHHCCGLPHHSH